MGRGSSKAGGRGGGGVSVVNQNRQPTPQERSLQAWQNNETNRTVIDILTKMPEAKKEQLKSKLDYQRSMGWDGGFSFDSKLTTYQEGVQIDLRQTRSNFSVWATKENGKWTFGRMPNRKSLHVVSTKTITAPDSGYDWDFLR